MHRHSLYPTTVIVEIPGPGPEPIPLGYAKTSNGYICSTGYGGSVGAPKTQWHFDGLSPPFTQFFGTQQQF